MQVIRFSDLPASPWKNGGGTTRQLLIHPPAANLDNFVWRISMADVTGSGPFSRFEGIDRTLALLSGDGLTLGRDGLPWQTLAVAGPALAFAGEWQIDCQLNGGTARDFNIMTRRSAASHQLKALPLADTQHLSCPANSLLLLAQGVKASLTVDGQTLRLATLDSIWFEHHSQVDIRASTSGALWLISFGGPAI